MQSESLYNYAQNRKWSEGIIVLQLELTQDDFDVTKPTKLKIARNIDKNTPRAQWNIKLGHN